MGNRESAHRSLDAKEVQRLISADKAARLDASNKKSLDWPGPYNFQILAEAVDKRRRFVDIDGKRFVIRYNDDRKDIFIKPKDLNKFVPCGYITYERLKAALTDEPG